MAAEGRWGWVVLGTAQPAAPWAAAQPWGMHLGFTGPRAHLCLGWWPVGCLPSPATVAKGQVHISKGAVLSGWPGEA